jgi:F-type H+-transporting ATPase subunit b
VQLDWTTFALEVVNFLVLVWILRHFFLKPIASIIAKRRQATQTVLEEAKRKETAAQSLKAGYEKRLAEWNAERDAARRTLEDELEKARAAGLARFREELAAEQEKAKAQQARETQRRRSGEQQEALAVAMRFSGKLLGRVASPEVEARLIRATLEDLRKLKPEQLAQSGNGTGDSVRVASAFPLPEEARKAVSDALKPLIADDTRVQFDVDESLLAGLRIRIGALLIDANLADELRFFTESFADDSRT